MITVGIIECGYVGGALKVWLENNNPEVKVVVSDPPKGMNDSLDDADIFFVSTHIPTEADGTQDLPLGRLLAPLHYSNVLFWGCAK